MERFAIIDKIKDHFGIDILTTDLTSDWPGVTVASSRCHDLIAYLKTNEAMGFTFLTDLTGIQYPDTSLPFGVIYHLHNFTRNQRIRIKAFLPKENPAIRTVTDLFPAANWMERETYDFYGIVFEGHPNLRRILNVDYMDYFPMRKEYPLEDATREDKDDRFFGR